MAKGNVYRRGSTWSVRFDNGRTRLDTDGKPLPNGGTRRVQVTKGGFRTKGEATAWLHNQANRLNRGEFVTPSRVTFGEFLADWLPTIKGPARASTWESYERSIRLHIAPKLGHVPLQQLGPEHLDRAYGELLDVLSPSSVRFLRAIVHRALRSAVSWGKVTRNVADQVEKIQGRSKEMTTWTGEQVWTFLERLAGDPLHVPVLLAATTGMRRGEVLGLRWRDVDLDAGRLSVRQTIVAPRNPATGKHEIIVGGPKTDKGRRSVPLPDQTVTALRLHGMVQATERDQAGPGYVDKGLVFCDPSGAPIHPDRFRERFDYRVMKSGLPRIRFHDLRHTYATLALEAGKPVKAVSEILGHATTAITSDLYQHVTPVMMEDTAEAVAALIRPPVSNR